MANAITPTTILRIRIANAIKPCVFLPVRAYPDGKRNKTNVFFAYPDCKRNKNFVFVCLYEFFGMVYVLTALFFCLTAVRIHESLKHVGSSYPGRKRVCV